MTSREYSVSPQECLSSTWPIAFPYLRASEGGSPLIEQEKQGSRLHNLFITLYEGLSGKAGPEKMTYTEIQTGFSLPHPPFPPSLSLNIGLQLVLNGCLHCRAGRAKVKNEQKQEAGPTYLV